jgi:DDE superfamily endonuclease
MTVLCPSERFYEQHGRRHQTLLERAWQIIRLVRRWLPGREVVCVADSSFAALEWLAQVVRLSRVSVITRLRLDAALYDPPPRAPRQPGRPRLKRKHRPTLEAVLADAKTQWSTLTMDD